MRHPIRLTLPLVRPGDCIHFGLHIETSKHAVVADYTDAWPSRLVAFGAPRVGRCEARSRHILHSAARTALTPAVDLQAEPADEPA